MQVPGNRLGDPGNTHAEHCCLIKVAEKYNVSEEFLGEFLTENTVLHTTMEPCNERLSGNRTCVERIWKLSGAIKVVYVGIKEPETFIGVNAGIKRLEDAGVKVQFVECMEDHILKVSTAGHEN